MIRTAKTVAILAGFASMALVCIGCSSIPDEGSLLDMTAKGERYLVTIVDYDSKNRIVSLYREFQGARSVQTNRMPAVTGGLRIQNGEVIRGAISVDVSEVDLNRNKQRPEFIRYDMEYYHHDGNRWRAIVSPERFLKLQREKRRRAESGLEPVGG